MQNMWSLKIKHKHTMPKAGGAFGIGPPSFVCKHNNKHNNDYNLKQEF